MAKPPHSDHRSTTIAGQLPFLSSSSSDFEFTVSLSPTSRSLSSTLCPADDIFFKGQLLPLHLSPRRSMLRSLLLVSSSSSSDTSNSRDSNGSSSSNDSTASYPTDMLLLTESDSPRPSSATDDDPILKLSSQKPNYLSSLRTKFSSVFNRNNKKLAGVTHHNNNVGSNSAKDAIKKYYTKKVKPLYEKLRNKGRERGGGGGVVSSSSNKELLVHVKRDSSSSHSFSGNLRFPTRKRCAIVGSCPSSMRSSPNHSGRSLPTVSLSSGSIPVGSNQHSSSDDSMEDLHSAIQGAIAHCKSSMGQVEAKTRVRTG